jgi:hypothetical protein
VRHSVSVACSLAFGIGACLTPVIPGRAAAPRPRVASYFGIPSTHCAIAPSRFVHHDRTRHSTWVGGSTLRANSAWYIVSRRLALGFGYRTIYGYPQKIFWQLNSRAHGPVTVHGWNVRTGQRIWFGRPLPGPKPAAGTAAPVIAWPSAIIRPHRFPSLTFVPSAGCYVLQAQWRGGSWSVPFTAGG